LHFNRTAVFFCFENTHWVVVVLDTAYYSNSFLFQDGEINADQEKLLQDCALKNKHILIFSHHNGYSVVPNAALNNFGKQVLECLNGLDSNKVVVWYYGHVHAGVVYKKNTDIGKKVFMRLSGHGGIPWGNAKVFSKDQRIAWFEQHEKGAPFKTDRVVNGWTFLTLGSNFFEEKFNKEDGNSTWSKITRI